MMGISHITLHPNDLLILELKIPVRTDCSYRFLPDSMMIEEHPYQKIVGYSPMNYDVNKKILKRLGLKFS